MGVEPRPLKSATEPWQKQPNLGVVFQPFLYTSCQGCLRGKESLGSHADITQAQGHQRHVHAGHPRLHERVRKSVQVLCSSVPFILLPSFRPPERMFETREGSESCVRPGEMFLFLVFEGAGWGGGWWWWPGFLLPFLNAPQWSIERNQNAGGTRKNTRIVVNRW